jgi:subtilisin family serine protease
LRRFERIEVRRKKPGFGGPLRADRPAHGKRVVESAERLAAAFQATLLPDAVDPNLIFKIRLAAGAFIQDDGWARSNLSVLSQEGDEALILFTDDVQLQTFRERGTAYTGGPPEGQINAPHAAFFDAIESLDALTPEDRIGAVLKAEGVESPADLDAGTVYVLDIEAWRPTDDMAPVFNKRVVDTFEAAGGEVFSEYSSSSALLLRGSGPGSAFAALLDLQEIASIDRPPVPDLEEGGAPDIVIADIEVVAAPDALSAAIGIVDSGVASGHPLLENVVIGAFGAGDLPDADEHGHGTGVAAIAAYGDLSQMLDTGQYTPQFRIASARVTDARGRFPDKSIAASAMDEAIRRLHAEFGCRVINVSLGDPHRLVGPKASAWAETLDNLARALDIVIVVSAGNSDKTALVDAHGDQVVAAYPAYLMENDANGLLDPAGALNVLTVGSIAHVNGLSDNDDVAVQSFCERGAPSPFTRCGPGLAGAIKPDLIDYGGTGVYDGTLQRIKDGKTHPAAGIVTLNHQYVQRLFSKTSGTSQAAPLVAHKAAALINKFPDRSANFIRALLGLSAVQPQAAVDSLGNVHERDRCAVLGYGHADLETALFSDDDRVILIAEDNLPLDKFAVYEIPVPPAFQTTAGERHINVSLAFDPPVRRTRKDYAGLRMSFDLVRGCDTDAVFEAYRKIGKDEEKPEKLKPSLVASFAPKTTVRGNATLQAASFAMKQNVDKYGDSYFLVVRALGGWAEGLVDAQRFAVAVMLSHQAQIGLYAQLQAIVRARVQT